jgi:hypothetical protein
LLTQTLERRDWLHGFVELEDSMNFGRLRGKSDAR